VVKEIAAGGGTSAGRFSGSGGSESSVMGSVVAWISRMIKDVALNRFAVIL
jgi:hypothetical protein